MLWNVVYEFYIKYIFGGRLNNVNYGGSLGAGRLSNDLTSWSSSLNTYNVTVTQLTDYNGDAINYSLGNYLSLIATIITMVCILLLCVFFIKKIIAIMFRLFTGGSSF